MRLRQGMRQPFTQPGAVGQIRQCVMACQIGDLLFGLAPRRNIFVCRDPTAATRYTLIGIAGAVLGGVSLSGGRGGLLGAAAGGAVLFFVQNLLSLAHVSAFYAQIAYGVILLAALALNGIAERVRHRRDHLASLRLSEKAGR